MLRCTHLKMEVPYQSVSHDFKTAVLMNVVHGNADQNKSRHVNGIFMIIPFHSSKNTTIMADLNNQYERNSFIGQK